MGTHSLSKELQNRVAERARLVTERGFEVVGFESDIHDTLRFVSRLPISLPSPIEITSVLELVIELHTRSIKISMGIAHWIDLLLQNDPLRRAKVMVSAHL